MQVTKICAAFESAPDLVELTDVQHHTLANVLKRYLGQLPEPLVTVVLYKVSQSFTELARFIYTLSGSLRHIGLVTVSLLIPQGWWAVLQLPCSRG